MASHTRLNGNIIIIIMSDALASGNVEDGILGLVDGQRC